jgi:hypothetical protein
MRFHIDWGKALHAIARRDAMRHAGTLAPRPDERQSPPLEGPSQNDGSADESAMITAVYEAHLSMEEMLAASAELRGDGAGMH